MRIDLAIKYCLERNIKVYPVHDSFKRQFIETSINGKTERSTKQVSGKRLNEEMTSRYMQLAESLL